MSHGPHKSLQLQSCVIYIIFIHQLTKKKLKKTAWVEFSTAQQTVLNSPIWCFVVRVFVKVDDKQRLPVVYVSVKSS